MNKYEYWLIDDRKGTIDSHGFIDADRYEIYRRENEIVFYSGTLVEKRFPYDWLEKIEKVKRKAEE